LIVPDKIPIGTIIMWNGLTIPDGWVLCDGSSGTPDLRSRFIVGAGGQYQLGATGGQNSVTLTEEQIPAHRHGLHGYDIGKQSKDTGQFHLTVEDDWRKPATARTADMDLAGGGGAHENRPPYYALLFIMKKKSTDTTITGPDGNTVSTAPYINIIKF
jgi:microcystin-dependent protein